MNIKKNIHKIENERFSFLLGFLGLFSVITIRNIFESAYEGAQILGFTPIVARSFYMLFCHFPLFYIALYVWLLLILQAITGEETKKIAKALLAGMWVIVITPFIDIISSHGSGYSLTYLKGLEEFTQIQHLFNFTKDLMQASWGQRIEILLVLMGTFLYVLVKTRNILKSFAASIICYLLIFVFGVLPNTIARIPSYLGFDILSSKTIISAGILGIDSQNYSIIFLVMILIAGILIIRKLDQNLFHLVVELKKSIVPVIAVITGTILALLLIHPYFPFTLYSPIHYAIFILIISVVHLINITPLLKRASYQFLIIVLFSVFCAISIGPVFLLSVIVFFLVRNFLRLPILNIIAVFLLGFLAFSPEIIPWHFRPESYGKKIAAWNYFINKDYEKAGSLYADLVKVKHDQEIIKRLGQCYLFLGNIDKGIATLENIPTLDYETALALSDAYIQIGKYDMALSVYQDAISRDIEPAGFYLKIAMLNARQGQEKNMEEALENGLRYGAPKHRLYQIRGDFYLRKRDFAAALAMYDKSLFYNPRSNLAYSGMGMLYYYRGDLINAERHSLKALSFEPNDEAIRNNLGVIYLVRGEYVKAQEQFMQSLKINPSQCEAYYNLGLIYENTGRTADALNMYEKALYINPAFMRAKTKIEEIGR